MIAVVEVDDELLAVLVREEELLSYEFRADMGCNFRLLFVGEDSAMQGSSRT